MALFRSVAMGKDFRHGFLQDGKGERTEKYQRAEQGEAYRRTVVDEARDVGQHGGGLARHQPFEIALQGSEQFGRIDPVRQPEDKQDDHRQQREQRVVSHRTGQQQTLVFAEVTQYAQGEVERMEDQLLFGFGDDGH